MKLKEISQISIHVEENAPITASPSLLSRLSQKVKQLVFKYLPKTSTPETQFKTTLALLLTQEDVRSYLFQDGKRREDFISALIQAAHECGFTGFSLPQATDPLVICQELTCLNGQAISLIDDQAELTLQSASLSPSKRQAILFSIFDRLERPPVHSVVEIKGTGAIQSIPLTTQYAQYKILEGRPGVGNISYSYFADHATSGIRTLHNSLPDSKGTMNQRVVYSTDTGSWIGSYCGELSTPFHVLEQILLIAGQTNGELTVVERAPEGATVCDLSILFTSLFSWYELSLITDQKAGVHLWDQKILLCNGTYYQLNLLYYNIPFNSSNRLPIPAEIKAAMQDINDEAWILLTAVFFRHLHIELDSLSEIAARVDSLRSISDHHFLEREKALLEEIDAFRALIPSLIEKLNACTQDPFLASLKGLYDKRVTGIDKLLCLDYAIKTIELFHNKNSRSGADRIAGAVAADKAQYAFQLIENKPFLHSIANSDEQNLFKNLYSNYLLREEPEVNAAFSSGFRKQVHQNPETRHYLTD